MVVYSGTGTSMMRLAWLRRDERLLSEKGSKLPPVMEVGSFLYTGIAAAVGNTMVLFTLYKYGTFKKRSINFLLANMAFSNIFVTFTGYPLTAISSFYGRWIFGYRACQFNGFSVFVLSSAAMGTHAALAVYRYIYVCQHNLRPKLTRRLTYYVIIFIWVHALFWSVTPLIGWSKYDYEPFGTSCSIDWVTRNFNNYSFMLLTTISNYVIPLAIMIICYWGVIRKSRKVDPLRVEARDQSVRVLTQLDRIETKIDVHVTKMCIIMTASFIAAWTPYAVESLTVPRFGAGVWVTTLPTMLAKSSCATYPYICLAASSTFRGDVVRMFRKTRFWRSHTIPAEYRQRIVPPEQEAQIYVRDTVDVSNKPSMSVYYDDKQIYIGSASVDKIKQESNIVQREHELIPAQFAPSGNKLNKPEEVTMPSSHQGNADTTNTTESSSVRQVEVDVLTGSAAIPSKGQPKKDDKGQSKSERQKIPYTTIANPLSSIHIVQEMHEMSTNEVNKSDDVIVTSLSSPQPAQNLHGPSKHEINEKVGDSAIASSKKPSTVAHGAAKDAASRKDSKGPRALFYLKEDKQPDDSD